MLCSPDPLELWRLLAAGSGSAASGQDTDINFAAGSAEQKSGDTAGMLPCEEL